MKRDMADRFLKPRSTMFRFRSPGLFYRWQIIRQTLSFLNRLRKDREVRRYAGRSLDEYQAYDDFEQRIYERGSTYTYNHGKMKLTSFKDVRDYALAPVIKEINTLIAEGNAKPRVLEAGCGNCINLMLLHKEFGEHIELVGIDITSQRLKVAQTYWGDKLGSAKIMVDSVLELKSAEDSSFDLVFSVHCLEQLPYDVDQAVKMMKRVSRNRIVFVEPVWENHNISQKLYTLYADHVRTLWPAVLSNDLKVIDTYAAELMANPLNRSGIIVAQKTVPDAAR